jgi:hypothetical protein
MKNPRTRLAALIVASLFFALNTSANALSLRDIAQAACSMGSSQWICLASDVVGKAANIRQLFQTTVTAGTSALDDIFKSGVIGAVQRISGNYLGNTELTAFLGQANDFLDPKLMATRIGTWRDGIKAQVSDVMNESLGTIIPVGGAGTAGQTALGGLSKAASAAESGQAVQKLGLTATADEVGSDDSDQELAATVGADVTGTAARLRNDAELAVSTRAAVQALASGFADSMEQSAAQHVQTMRALKAQVQQNALTAQQLAGLVSVQIEEYEKQRTAAVDKLEGALNDVESYFGSSAESAGAIQTSLQSNTSVNICARLAPGSC